MNMNKLGNRLIWARQRLGWSAADLIRESGVPQGTISKIERGDQNQLGKYGLDLQKALNVSLEWLSSGIGEPIQDVMKHNVSTLKDFTVDNSQINTTHSHVTTALQKQHGEIFHIQSYEYWARKSDKEVRYMSVPIEWLRTEGYKGDELKSIEMPDDSQKGLLNKGYEVAVNIDWGDKLINDLYYAMELGGVITIRRVEHQFNDDILLTCLNEQYRDQLVPSDQIHLLVERVIGVAVRFQGTFPRTK